MNSNSSNAFLLELFKVGIANVQPRNILSKFLKVVGEDIIVTDKNKEYSYREFNKVVPICVGKASVDMGLTAYSILKDCKNKLAEGIIVVILGSK